MVRSSERRQLLAHLGFEDVIPQAEGGTADASLAAAAESLQLTSPREVAGSSPPSTLPETNGNAAFGDEGEAPETCSLRCS